MSTPTAFSQGLADSLTKISLVDFFRAIQSQFYPTQDISFMEFFLELTEHETEFCVHHDKLVEYAVKTKLDTLELVDGVDFTLQDVLERGTSGASVWLKPFSKATSRSRALQSSRTIFFFSKKY
jgi:hypothetical protein